MCSVCRPSGTLWSFHKLRNSMPAPVSKTNETAICAATKISRRNIRRGPVALDPVRDSTRRFLAAGASPKSSPQINEPIQAKKSTRPSSEASFSRGMPSGASSVKTRSRVHASAQPNSPPISPSNMVSVSVWRTSRPRLAPNAARTANSR